MKENIKIEKSILNLLRAKKAKDGVCISFFVEQSILNALHPEPTVHRQDKKITRKTAQS